MKKNLLLIVMAAILAAAPAYGKRITVIPNNKYVSKVIPGITEFNAIDVPGSLDVDYSQKADGPEVSVYCPDNMLDVLDIHVRGSKLVVKLKDNVMILGKHDIKVTVSSAALEEVSITSSGDMDINGALTAENFMVKVTGSGDFDGDNISCSSFKASVTGSGDMDVDRLECKTASIDVTGSGDAGISQMTCDNVNASLMGSGEIELEGTAATASLSTMGSGSIDAKELMAKNVTARTSGSGSIQCYAGESLSATALGSGQVLYSGSPGKVDRQGKERNIKAR